MRFLARLLAWRYAGLLCLSFTLNMAAGLPSSCNCAGQPDQAFGSSSDMSSWLNSALDPGAIAANASDWY